MSCKKKIWNKKIIDLFMIETVNERTSRFRGSFCFPKKGGKEDGFIYDWRKIWMGC